MGLFTDDDVWSGGFYELALEYRRGSTPALVDGLRAIWSASAITGCYLECASDPEGQSRAEFEPSLPFEGHLYGVATLPTGSRIACGTCCIREDDGADWLVFYFPMGALGYSYPVGAFPFDDIDHEPWQAELDAWLTDLGREVFDAAPFRLGLVGFETSGDLHANEVVKTGVPAKRHYAVLTPTSRGLAQHPRPRVRG